LYILKSNNLFENLDFDNGLGWNSGNNFQSRGNNMGGGMRGGMDMKGSGNFRGNDNWNSNNTGVHCVHMRGLPFRATEQDIADVNIRLYINISSTLLNIFFFLIYIYIYFVLIHKKHSVYLKKYIVFID
jgi:hypothetical protein